MSYHLSCFINQQCYGKVTLYFAFGLFSYKKKKTFAADLRIWDIGHVLHGANTAQALHEKDDAILPDSEVHVSLTKQWLYFVNGSSEQSPPAYPGHWGSSIDFSHWVLWLFQIFICPLLLDSSTSLGLPVTNILDHRS